MGIRFLRSTLLKVLLASLALVLGFLVLQIFIGLIV